MEFCYRRNLPHWRQDQVTYFVTWRLGRGREELDASKRDLVVAGIKSFDGQRYQPAAYVVMDDHVHALLTPFARYELKAILHSWKSFTARQMQREHKRFGRVWQDESFDRIVRDDEEFVWPLDRGCKRWREQRRSRIFDRRG